MDREALEGQIQVVEERISKGEELIARQIQTIQQLQKDGHRTREARLLLEHFEDLQEAYTEVHNRLVVQLGRRKQATRTGNGKSGQG